MVRKLQMRLHQRFLSQLKRLGRDNHWLKHAMAGGGESTIRIIENYKIEIREDDKEVWFVIKSKDVDCIRASLYKDDNTASLLTAKYDAGCTIDGNMVRGEKGTRKMIHIALDLLKEYGATSVALMDNSTVPCEGEDIDLGAMYFLKYGMAWYEKYFGFQPTERHRKAYEQAKEMRLRYLDTEKLKDLPCSYFTDEFIDDLFDHIKLKIFYRIEWVKHLV